MLGTYRATGSLTVHGGFRPPSHAYSLSSPPIRVRWPNCAQAHVHPLNPQTTTAVRRSQPSCLPQSGEEKRLYEQELAQEELQASTAMLTDALMEVLPHLEEDRLVQLLEFVAVQHSGNNFNTDNTGKAAEIAAFLERQPFAATALGVTSLAMLARHALKRSEGEAKRKEHRLWLITSGALNTAAAILHHGGEPAAFFEALERDTVHRNLYFQRDFAKRAMKEHVATTADIDYRERALASERKQQRQVFIDQYCGGSHLTFAAIMGGIGALIVAISFTLCFRLWQLFRHGQ